MTRKLLLTAVVVLATGYLVAAGSSVPLHGDTVQDLLLAEDCSELGHCVGRSTSFREFQQGRGWILLLTQLRAEPSLVLALSIALQIVAIALAFLLSLRLVDRRTALTVAILFAGFAVWSSGHPVLYHPTLSPLPLVCFYAALIGIARDPQSWPPVVGAGICLGIGLETHLTSALAFPVLMAGIARLHEHRAAPWLGLLVAIGLHTAISPDSVRDNIGHLGVIGVAFSGAGVVAAWFWGARRQEQAHFDSPAERSVWLLKVAAASVGLLVSAGVVGGLSPSPRYFLAAGFPLAFVIGRSAVFHWRSGDAPVLNRYLKRTVVFATLGVFVGLPLLMNLVVDHLVRSPTRPRYSLSSAMSLVTELRTLGLTHSDFLTRLRTPDLTRLIGVAGLEFGRLQQPLRFERPNTIVRVVAETTPTNPLPAGWLRRPGFLISTTLAPWIRYEGYEVCLGDQCRQSSPDEWQQVMGGTDGFHSQLATPTPPTLAKLREDGGGHDWVIRLPIHALGDDSRRLVVGPFAGDYLWHFDGTEGLSSTVLPDGTIALTKVEGDRGKLVMVARGKKKPEFLPLVMEFQQAEVPLTRLLVQASPLERWLGKRLDSPQ